MSRTNYNKQRKEKSQYERKEKNKERQKDTTLHLTKESESYFIITN